MTSVTHPECGRVFDLLDENDAGEWYYGHDCEVIEEPRKTPVDIRGVITDNQGRQGRSGPATE